MRSPVRLKFGVAPITLYMKPAGCGGKCVFCPWHQGLPHSYLPNEDTERAKAFGFCPEKQLSYILENHVFKQYTSVYDVPLEVILLGGSFSSLGFNYRDSYVRKIMKRLEEPFFVEGREFRARCSVLTVESRPDQICRDECLFMRGLGVSKIEIGVQHTCDSVLRRVARGHTQSDVKLATRILKREGFKVGYHVMLGLPGSSREKDIEMLTKTLWSKEYVPDYLKIYPCELLKDRMLQPALHEMVDNGTWFPPDSIYCMEVLRVALPKVPSFVRVSRIQRQFDRRDVVKGIEGGLRLKVNEVLRDISTREAGNGHGVCCDSRSISDLELSCKLYRSGESAYFEVCERLSGALLAIARVQFRGCDAVLRELKVFGRLASVGGVGQVQGRGLGTSLLFEVEKAAVIEGASRLLVNSAPGARSFFERFDYKIGDTCLMEKWICLEQFGVATKDIRVPLNFGYDSRVANCG